MCEDGIFYLHLFWEGKHYAAVPREWNANQITYPNGRTSHGGVYRERPDIKWITVNYNGQERSLCFGKEVTEFDGIEEFNKLLEESRKENEK